MESGKVKLGKFLAYTKSAQGDIGRINFILILWCNKLHTKQINVYLIKNDSQRYQNLLGVHPNIYYFLYQLRCSVLRYV